MIDAHDLETIRKTDRKLANYMGHYLAMQMLICTIYLGLSGAPEDVRKAEALWDELKWSRPALYRRLRFQNGNLFLLPGRLGRRLDLFVYRQIRKIYKFN